MRRSHHAGPLRGQDGLAQLRNMSAPTPFDDAVEAMLAMPRDRLLAYLAGRIAAGDHESLPLDIKWKAGCAETSDPAPLDGRTNAPRAQGRLAG